MMFDLILSFSFVLLKTRNVKVKAGCGISLTGSSDFGLLMVWCAFPWQVIQGRSLDQLYILEENLLSGKGDLAAVELLLQVGC